MGLEQIFPSGVKPFDHIKEQLSFTNVDPAKPYLQTATPSDEVMAILKQCVTACAAKKPLGGSDNRRTIYSLEYPPEKPLNEIIYMERPPSEQVNMARLGDHHHPELIRTDNKTAQDHTQEGKKEIFYNAGQISMYVLGAPVELDEAGTPTVDRTKIVAAEILPKTAFRFSDPAGRPVIHAVLLPSSEEASSAALLSINSRPYFPKDTYGRTGKTPLEELLPTDLSLPFSKLPNYFATLQDRAITLV